MMKSDYTIKDVRKRKRDFIMKIILPTLITLLLFILTIFLIIIPRFKSMIMYEKREMIRELTNSACSILEKFESYEREGLLTRAEAQKQAVEQIRHLRYGDENKDYFWISDMHPNMVVHPYRSDLQGKALDQFSDPMGKKLFLEFVKVVEAEGHGFVEYMWQWKDDPNQIASKLSYVKGFKPWGWIIGTGIYIEDVKKEIRSLTHNLILISLVISLVMVLLLAFIIQQSTRIEEERVEAENKLLESMEKYRTLVQATTEGLIMVMDDAITFANPRIQQLTGYTNEELAGKSFNMLLDDRDAMESLADGQFEVMLKTKDGTLRQTLVTVSSIAISEKNGKILTLKDVTTKEVKSLKADDYRQLISNYNLGFITLALDSKGRIVHANETVASILGYDNAKELEGLFFLALFVSQESGRRFRNSLVETGAVQADNLILRRKDGSDVIVSISLMVVASETKYLQCEGIIGDITEKIRQKQASDELIMEMKSASMFMEQPLYRYMRKLYSINMHDPVLKAERLMAAKKTDILSVVTDVNEHIGVITFSDLRRRVVFKQLNPETKVFEVMSSPLVSAGRETSISDLLLLAAETGVDHIVVTDGQARGAGVAHIKDIPQALFQTQRFMENQIKAARSTDELHGLFLKVQNIARPLIEQNILAKTTGRLIGAISGKITNRIIELAIEELGAPPVDFAFIVLGSEGRLEQTLETDQDNAIIYRDVSEEEQNSVKEYFARLSLSVCDSLHQAGFNYCKGNVMAKNPRWCVPLKTWKNYFNGWINTPDPQNILDVSIFFDLRPVAGNFELAHDLRRHISQVVQDKQVFFYNFAENVLNFKSAVRFTGNIITEKRDNRELFDLKYAITPVVMFARIYALYKNIESSNTVERLTILNREQVLSDNDFHEILFGYNYLMQLRYKHQIEMADRNLPTDNLIDIKELTDIEMTLIKKIFASITRLQSMLSTQFKKVAV